tara:strand:+ start:23147 stop:25018 length:1872 start_codon:yes stop_codon:yes gene_type:complete
MNDQNLKLTVESIASDRRHTIVVSLGDKEIYRDDPYIDRADERHRFTEGLAAKFPAIACGAAVSPDDINAKLMELAAGNASAGKATNVNIDSKAEPFPIDLMPPVVRRYMVEGAKSRATDLRNVALPIIVTLAACIGTTRRISPKKGWTAPSIIWGAVVARSGSVKSVGYDLSCELLEKSEAESIQAHSESLEKFYQDELQHRKALSQWNKLKDGSDPPVAPVPSPAARLVVDDQTLESVAVLLAENPRGLYLLTDELRGFFDGMGLYSSSGGRDEARWLTFFDGRPFSVDRKTNRERIYVPMAGVSISGTIQPGTLAKVVSEGQVESGLLARMLLVMPEPQAKKWTDDEMSEITRLAMQRLIDELRTLEHETVDGHPRAVVLTLTDEAKARFIRFVNAHGVETIQHNDALAAAWSKLEGYALRFALVDHLARWASGDPNCDANGPVGIQSIEAGIELSRWFANEAERVYSRIGVKKGTDGIKPDRHLDRLAEWLASHGGSATEREISRGPQRYRSKTNQERLNEDCAALVATGRATWEAGRKTRRLVLIDAGDSGDGDISGQSVTDSTEVSPDEPEDVAIEPATHIAPICDTIDESVEKPAQLSPSPVSPPDDQVERVKVRI